MGKFIDMTGWKMWEHGVPDSRLTVIEREEDGVNTNGYPIVRWLCECNCKEHTRIIVNAYSLKSGHTKSCGCVKKEKIIQQGHLNKKYNTYDLSGEYGIGWTTRGEPFYFDIEDYDKIKDYCWHSEEKGYIVTDTHNIHNRKIKMHRLLTGTILRSQHVDHINHKTNDNRKSNLRVCTAAENNWNVEKRIDNSSGYPGVSWHKRDLCWEVHIQVNKHPMYIGRFNSFEDAVNARVAAEEKYFKEFSFKNSKEMSTYVQ